MAELPSISSEAFPHMDMFDLPDNTVGTFTDDILDLVLVGHVEGDLPRSPLRGVLLAHVDDGGVLRGMVSSEYP
jgi:hypothetical protein